jgi:uncharacterized protein
MHSTTLGNGRRVAPPAAATFFGVTFAWTWALWLTAAATGASVSEPAGAMLYMAGGLGPLVGAVWLLRRADPAYRRDVLRRVWDPRRITAPWWLALAVVAAGPALVAAVTVAVAGADATMPTYGVGAIGGAIAVALLAGLAEEPGWRGVASDAWQRRTLPAWAAAGIGAIWALWHLPLAFIEGTYYHELGIASVEYWLTLLTLAQVGVLFVWLANGGGGSILLAILAHALFNVAVSLAPRSTIGDLVAFAAITVMTVAVVAATRGRLQYVPSD